MKLNEFKALFNSLPMALWPEMLEKLDATTGVTVQKEKERLWRRYREYQKKIDQLKDLKTFDVSWLPQGFVIGVDEAGRGPLAGPVVAAACVIDFHEELLGLDDSKKLTHQKREDLFEVIKSNAIAYGIGIVDEKRIDQVNILNATKEAMVIAIQQTLDGLKTLGGPNARIGIITDHVRLEHLAYPLNPVVKGDQKSYAVAAASILAKVTRDQIMCQMSNLHPHYGFEVHKGYGTPSHYKAIDQYGISPIHRLSFLKQYTDNQ